MNPERRRTDRIPDDVLVLLTSSIGDHDIRSGRTRDLGGGGACVVVPQPFPSGLDLYAGFFLEGYGGLPLVAKVRVVWNSTEGDEHLIGLSFRDEGPTQRDAVERMRDYLAARRRELVGSSS